ncbi:MAG: hypothetical protein A3E02_02530 [Candidatus Zambryskibacteria bacterium RIFCSPHIGHO2_12_FULL_38_34]|nr:MAG: hypothetical protein A3D37_00080 [Candidatus Zambryskibacteria bacterium RIFCSPHIGHO2_02_FULL_38_22]OHA97665.1 MAG: hypothetical protein A3E02_02530 [Candidatus Zambryskibacteria bacterium RIFCSPHIGHO2_12_FULL_38_34]OHB08700.1 MAG: hypothetical protein A3I19_01350 [Candidatus Zambryskibacteria bacterium RIFCSPLOWO2_02_FULL_38_13]
MKKFLSLIIVGVVAVGPVIVLAQNWDIPQSNDGIAYASIFAGNFSLLLSILIGIIANVIIFRAAKRLGGGLFGSVLNYIGIGVSFIVLGTIATVVNPWFISFWFNITSTACFAVGYIFTVIGANKLLKGIMST